MRRLRALIQGLPPGSALHRRLDPDGWAWKHGEELLAGIAELVDYGNRLFFSANRKNKGTRIPKPIKIKRPWETEKEQTARAAPRKQANSAEIHSFFSRRKR